MGQNGAWFVENWRVVADVRRHDLHVFFSTRAQPAGGLELLVWTKNGLSGIRVRVAGEELVPAAEGERGCAWEFVRVA
jgi:hypothetical protein